MFSGTSPMETQKSRVRTAFWKLYRRSCDTTSAPACFERSETEHLSNGLAVKNFKKKKNKSVKLYTNSAFQALLSAPPRLRPENQAALCPVQP